MNHIIIVRVVGLVILSMFEVWLYYQLLFCTLVNKKYVRKRNWIIMWISILVIGLSLAFNRVNILFSHNVFLFVIVLMLLFTWLICRKEKVVILGIELVYFSLLSLLDFGFTFLGMAVLGNQFSEMIYFEGIHVEKLAVLTGSRLIVLFLVWIVKKNDVHKMIIEFEGILLPLGIVCMVLVRRYQVLLASMAFAVVEINWKENLMSLLIYVSIISCLSGLVLKNKLIKKENSFLQMKEELEQQKYEEIFASVERNKELIHDMKNHYLVISEYERNGQYAELHKYVTELKNNFIEVTPKIYTGNLVIDLLISQKKLLSEHKFINFSVKVVPIPRLKFKDRELCSIFGNLLDNAIEACEKIDGEKWIQVRVEKQSQLLFIQIANSIGEHPQQKSNGFFSAKKNGELHGYGLKSVKRIVEQYEGAISINIKENSFIVRITFFELE